MAIVEQKSQGKIGRTCERLRQDILRGLFQPGSMLPTQREIGKRYGVAQATASAAVGRLVHEGLAVTVHGRGSFVAEDLPVEHQIIDLVRMRAVDSLLGRSAWLLAWIEEFTQCSEQCGWTPRWHHILEDDAKDTEQLGTKFSKSKGVITFGTVPIELPWLLHGRGIPVVTVVARRGGLGEGPMPYPQISFDRRESAVIATEHLVSLGYRRIGFVGLIDAPLRKTGFMDVLQRHELSVEGNWVLSLERDVFCPGDVSDRLCRELCRQILKAKSGPEAICCSTQRMAHTLESEAMAMGLRVPDDLAIIACDETEPDIPHEVGISTVAVSRKQCCQKALELVEQVGAREELENLLLLEPIMMPLHLTIRDSCGARLKGVDTKEIGG